MDDIDIRNNILANSVKKIFSNNENIYKICDQHERLIFMSDKYEDIVIKCKKLLFDENYLNNIFYVVKEKKQRIIKAKLYGKNTLKIDKLVKYAKNTNKYILIIGKKNIWDNLIYELIKIIKIYRNKRKIIRNKILKLDEEKLKKYFKNKSKHTIEDMKNILLEKKMLSYEKKIYKKIYN